MNHLEALKGLGIGQAAGSPLALGNGGLAASSPPGPPGPASSPGVVPGPPGGRHVAVPREERVTGKTLSYDQIVDALLLSLPGETQGNLAKRLGYTQSWLSRLIASESFQVRLAERLEKDVAPERREMFRLRFASIEEEARGILLASLNKLAARLEDPAGVPDELLIKSAATTSKLLGYGARQDPPPQKVEMHFHLEQLAKNIRSLNGSPSAAYGGGQGVREPVVIDQPGGTKV